VVEPVADRTPMRARGRVDHLTEEEKTIFMPGVSYEEFVEAQE
jgi:hypothetical protein